MKLIKDKIEKKLLDLFHTLNLKFDKSVESNVKNENLGKIHEKIIEKQSNLQSSIDQELKERE